MRDAASLSSASSLTTWGRVTASRADRRFEVGGSTGELVFRCVARLALGSGEPPGPLRGGAFPHSRRSWGGTVLSWT